MFKKVFFCFIFFTVFSNYFYSQSTIGENWQLGLGGSIVRFSDEDASYIGDKHLIQAPRFNATRRINNDFSLDFAIAFGSFDSLVIKNNVPYFSFDLSGRYRYASTLEKLDPFVFVGASIVDSAREMTPTFNIGTGVSYWFTDMFGISTQLYYKHSLDSFAGMRSHIQVTGGLIFGLNLGKNAKRKVGSGSSCYYDQHR